jgi:RNA polymerase sigma-70 factor (ECF subfamily)
MTAVAGFDLWYRTHYGPVVAALSAYAGDREAGREAADEAFARAWERWGEVSALASPQGWVFVVGRNVLHRRLRRRGREVDLWQRRGDRVTAAAAAPPGDPELWAAIAGLPRRQREVVVLRYLADWSERDVADALDLRPGTVGRTLHDARARLARELGGDP